MGIYTPVYACKTATMSSPETYTLIGYWISSCTYRIRLAFAHFKIDYAYIPVDLSDDHYAENVNVSDLSQVPVLKIQPSDGGPPIRITQSMAIIRYISCKAV